MPVIVAETLDAACAALAARPGATLLAGGTDLMVGVNAGTARPDDVIAIGRLDELSRYDHDGQQLTIGSAVAYAALMDEPIAELAPVLAQAARSVGSPQIRNAGTLGGNLGTASPAGDGTTALVALGGTVELVSTSGRRQVDLADFVTGPRRTQRRPDEIIESVTVPILDGPQEFLKVGTRNAMVIAVASAALVVDRSRRQVRLALGSVGPRPIRCTEAEAHAAATVDWDAFRSDPDAAIEFGRLAAAAARPIDDHRSTAAYRRHAVQVIARRAFERAFVR